MLAHAARCHHPKHAARGIPRDSFSIAQERRRRFLPRTEVRGLRAEDVMRAEHPPLASREWLSTLRVRLTRPSSRRKEAGAAMFIAIRRRLTLWYTATLATLLLLSGCSAPWMTPCTSRQRISVTNGSTRLPSDPAPPARNCLTTSGASRRTPTMPPTTPPAMMRTAPFKL